jgi:hypothetical protein
MNKQSKSIYDAAADFSFYECTVPVQMCGINSRPSDEGTFLSASIDTPVIEKDASYASVLNENSPAIHAHSWVGSMPNESVSPVRDDRKLNLTTPPSGFSC